MSIIKIVLKYRLGNLGKSSIINSFSLILRALIQTLYLLLMTTWLGIEGYGLFSGIVALFCILTPLSNWGSNLLITKYISLDKNNAKKIWATSLFQTIVIGSSFSIFLLTTSYFIFPKKITFIALLLLSISELVLIPITNAASNKCFALERSNVAAFLTCLVPFSRFLCLLIAFQLQYIGTPLVAAWTYFLGTTISVLVSFLIIFYISGLPQWKNKIPFLSATKEGTPYALSNFANSSYLEVDKIIILYSLGSIILGAYTISFRVTSIFILPIIALISVFLPRMMTQIHEKRKNKKTFRLILIITISYSILASFSIFIISPFIPNILGEEYKEAVDYLKLFAIWPIFFGIRQVFTSWLTAQNEQEIRMRIEIFGLFFILCLNMLLVPYLGAKSSIFILIFTDIFVVLICYYFIKSINPVKSDISN